MAFTPNQLTAVADSWAAAGLPADPVGAIASTAAGRLHDLADEYRQLRADDNERDIVRRLASGEITLAGAVTEHHASASGHHQAHRAAQLRRAAIETVCNTAHRQLCALGDKLITGHLAPAHAEIIALVAKHAPEVEGIGTDIDVVRAGGKARSAWGLLADAVEQRSQVTKALRALTAAGVLPPLADSIDPAHRTYGRPDLKPRGLARSHPIRHLVTLVAAGMEPGVYTADEAAERAAIVARAQRESAAA